MKYIHNVINSILIAALLFGAPVSFRARPKSLDKLEKFMRAQVAVYGFGGTVIVVKDGRVLLKKAYGLADFEWNTPNTIDTKFSLASVSKQFTAAAVLQLAERGKLSLDDKLSRFFPNFPNGEKVTIKMLLTHRSGLAHDFTDVYMKSVGLSKDAALSLIAGIPYDFEPGEKTGYSNIGFFLLSLIVEKASGENFADYMKRSVFQPAGMLDTKISRPDEITLKLARPYFRPEKTFVKAPYINWNLITGADGVYSTVEDLYRWQRALQNGKVLTAASVKKMETPTADGYGYGVGVLRLHDRPVIAHAGQFFGASTTLDRYPEDDLIIAVLSNKEGGIAAMRVSTALAAIVFGKDVEIARQRVETRIDPALYDKYAGKYGVYEFVKTADGKFINKNDGEELRPESKTKFFFLNAPEISVEFIANDKDAITSLVLMTNGVKKIVERGK